MAQNEWENLGREIQEIVNDAVSENNYASLNDTINKVPSSAIDSGSDALKSVIEGALGGNSGRRRSSGSRARCGRHCNTGARRSPNPVPRQRA